MFYVHLYNLAYDLCCNDNVRMRASTHDKGNQAVHSQNYLARIQGEGVSEGGLNVLCRMEEYAYDVLLTQLEHPTEF